MLPGAEDPMATDLSQQARDSLWLTSQGAGNMLSSNKRAMTAPGSQPVTPMPSLEKQEDPDVGADDFDGRQTVHGTGTSGTGSWDDLSGQRLVWKP
jgi:hypothetical protein